MTLAELRAAREAAAATLATQSTRLNADGYTPTAEDEAAWATANAGYTTAHDAEEAELGRLAAAATRASAADRIAADATRLNAAGIAALRPDYRPASAAPNTPTLPATPRRHGPIRAFKGNDAALRAERAGMWAAASLYGSSHAQQWCAAHGLSIERGSFDGPGATLNTNNNAGAGYFVPNEVDYAIVELMLEYGVFRANAAVVPMSSGTKDSPRWTGGMTAYWIAEGAAPTQSDPSWDMISLIAKNLGAMTKMTRQLEEDSAVDLGDKITMAMAEAFTYAEDNAAFNGDATSTYGGITGLITKILATAGAYHQAATGNVTDLTLDFDDFGAVMAKLPNFVGIKPKWYMHKTVWANSIERLQMAAGGVSPADFNEGGKPTMRGYPVVFVNVMDPTPGVNEIAAIFGDLGLSSKLGDRRGRTVESGLINDDFTKQLMTILGTERVAINNHTVTNPRDATLPGPVIGLKLAAS